MTRRLVHFIGLLKMFSVVACQDHQESIILKELTESVKKCNEGIYNVSQHVFKIEQYANEIYKRSEHVQKKMENVEDKLGKKLVSLEYELRLELREGAKSTAKIINDGLDKIANTQEENARHSLQSLQKKLVEEIDVQTVRMEQLLKRRLKMLADSSSKCETIGEQLKDDVKNFTHVVLTEIQQNIDRKPKRLAVSTTPKATQCNDNDHVDNAISCHQLRREEVTCDGTFLVQMEKIKAPFYVYCDMNDDEGGWTVILRRDDYGDTNTDFDQNWSQYKEGFGNMEEEFWLGNDKIHAITSTGEKFLLRVTLESFDGDRLDITYDSFRVDNEESGYRLHVGQPDIPELGNSLTKHDGKPFSTKDRNNDSPELNCATRFKGGWWFTQCYFAMLTGPHLETEDDFHLGIKWLEWKDDANLKSALMKIRPKNF